MAISFAYDAQRAILFTKAHGLITFEAIEDHIRREAEAGHVQCREVFDALDASTNLTTAEVKVLVRDLLRRTKDEPFGPTAVVTASDVLFGMTRMLETLLELNNGPALAAFRTPDEAIAWLLAGAPRR